MTKPKIIAIVGMPGSGKGTTVDHLEDSYHLPKVYFGGMVYDEVKRRGLDIVMDERMVREDMRKQEGPAVLAKRAALKADEMLDDGAQAVVLDGLYSWSEDRYLREKYDDSIITIAIVNPKHIRYERVVARKDAHRPYTLEQIQLRDIEEIENIEKGGPIAFADYYLANAKNVDELKVQIDELMQQLGF
ncbi:MAG TPA: AAA family ATPase [Candidatus Saccharimonadales bacterium]|nr:AAA family ATPase [Candidatus Saccharimonadales bacterium]